VPYLVDGQDGGNGNPIAANRVIVDGALRVDTPPGKRTVLYGKRGSSYIVASDRHLYRVNVDGSTRLLAKNGDGSIVLSENGKRAAVAKRAAANYKKKNDPVPVKVINTKNGKVVAERSFPGTTDVLAVDGNRVLMSNYLFNARNQRTLDWKYKTNSTRLLTRRIGTEVDLASNRLVATKGRHGSQCVIVSELSNPKKVLRKTCDGEQVDSLGPNGFMLTYNQSVNDQHSGDVLLRDRVGNLVARYDVPNLYGVFSNGPAVGAGTFSQWEASGSVLIGQVTYTPHPAIHGLARCTTTSCEPAGASWTTR
jgi:hypothetical protein